MISNLNSMSIHNVHKSKSLKNSKIGKTKSVSKQGDKSKVEKIKDALNNGEYKFDLETLSELIADELL